MSTLVNKTDPTGYEATEAKKTLDNIIEIGMPFIKLDKEILDKAEFDEVEEILNTDKAISYLEDKNNKKMFYRVVGKDPSRYLVYYCSCKGNIEFYYMYYEDFLDSIYKKKIVRIKDRIIYPNDDLISKEELELVQKKEEAMLNMIDMYEPDFLGLKSSMKKDYLRDLADFCGMEYKRFRILINDYIKSGFKRYSLYPKNSKAFQKKRAKYNYKNKPGRKCVIAFDKYKEDEENSDIDIDLNKDNKALSVLNDKVLLEPGIVITADIEKIFDKYIKLYLTTDKPSIRSVYNQMNNDYFMKDTPDGSIMVLKPVDERPTLNQFRYYLYKNTSNKERKEKRLGIREFRNNHRKLESDTQISILAPGQRVEIDAWEVPVAVIDDSRKNILGKPVLYAMCDCKTKLVLAASLSFENNSYIGLTSLFLNMTLEKRDDYISEEERLASYNICNVSKILPREIVTDRGSDFISKDFAEVLDRIHIDHRIAPAATGSYKGNVEQLFNQLDLAIKPLLKGKGYVTKDYGENPYKEACLTLNGLSRIIHNTIVQRNIKLNENITPSKELIDNNVNLSPVCLWEYYTQSTLNRPRTIKDTLEYAYNLMIEKRATITRNGISYKGLTYDCHKDKVLQNKYYQAKSEKMYIRIDPRDNSSVFYKRDGKIYKADLMIKKLANKSYAGLTWYEYKRYKDKMRQIKNKNTELNNNLNSLHGSAVKQIVEEEVSEKPTYTDIKNIRENRKVAKELNTNKNSIKNKVPFDQESQVKDENEDNKNVYFNKDNIRDEKKDNRNDDYLSDNEEFYNILEDLEDLDNVDPNLS